MKILLIDDDASLRDMYATKFSECGHTVDAADTRFTTFGGCLVSVVVLAMLI